MTPATAFLKSKGISYTEHVYEYVEHGGTTVSAGSLGVPEHEVVKTLVMQDERALPLIVLMHGDRKVSTKNLARQTGRKSIEPCRPEVAQRHTGYQVGGTSPFGTRKPLPVYMEKSIAALQAIYINGGRRGLLVRIKTQELVSVLKPQFVEVALED
ncbi:MAG TPA: Cys-tRNA(Pro) deacylase [Burkholderiales bacterium]|jgi:Cys-tRNA(Pro) deacylase|nr:Cys-tRNA(Pro) deacylase [Burkholderiales bacterium]